MAASELPAGCVVMEGWLMKRSQQLLQWRWRYVKLTSDQHLATFTSEQGDVLTNDVDIGGATAEATDFFLAAPVEFGFLVACRDKTLRFAAETAATREEWLRKIASIAGRESLDPEKDESPGFRRRDSPSSSILLQPLEEFVGEESPTAGSPGKGKGSKGPGKPGKGGPGKGPGKAPPKGKGKGPPVPGKGVPRLRTMPKASSLPLGRRLSVRMLNADQVAAFAPEKRDHASSSDDEPSPLNPAAVDLEALRSAFAAQAKAPASARATSRRSPRGVELLPRSNAQNVAIVLRKLHLDTQALAASLDQLQPGDCSLTAEECERFTQVLPPVELLRPLADYEGDISGLRDVEREILPLAQLTRLRERLRLLSLFKTLDERLGDAMQQMCAVQTACGEVRKSTVLRNLLQIIVVLFNYVNYGQAPSEKSDANDLRARNVDVQSLTHLVETQSFGGPFPKFNMLHFCLQELLKQCPDLQKGALDAELAALPSAACVNLAQVKLALERLQADLQFVQTELYGHQEEYRKKDIEEEDPPTPPPVKGPVKFDLEENDTASEDEVAPGSEEEGLPKVESPRRSVLGRLVSMGIDTWSFAEEWCQGSAMLGVSDNEGLQAVMAADGEVPPPGVLLRWRPSGRWKAYFCEVRGALLVLYRVKRSTAVLRGTFYIVLPGAEVSLLQSLYASEHAREIAREHPHGIELRPAGGREEYFLAKSAKEAGRWLDFLTLQTKRGDAGHVSHYVGGWGLLSSCWRRLFCVIERGKEEDSKAPGSSRPRLLGFSRLRDYAEGLAPEATWTLEDMRVHAFDAEGSSATAKGLLPTAPIGLELEYPATQSRVQLACDSAEHLDAWLEVLRSVQTGGMTARRGSQSTLVDDVKATNLEDGVDHTRLFDLFGDQSPTTESKSLSFCVVEADDATASTDRLRRLMFSVGANGSSDQETKHAALPAAAVEVIQIDSDCEEEGYDEAYGMPWVGSFCQLSGATEALDAPDALSQLKHLEVEMTGVVEKWSRTLAATEADCRGLLRFFGLGAPEESQLAEAAAQLLRALSTFRGQVGDAWAELEQHASEEARKRGTKKPGKPLRTRARTQTAATDTSEAPMMATRSESNETLDTPARSRTHSADEAESFVSVHSAAS